MERTVSSCSNYIIIIIVIIIDSSKTSKSKADDCTKFIKLL
jgi:hypothetical protein